MSDYDNTNRGAIWRNEDKESDKHPDFKGSLNVNGQEFWVSAWKRKEGANLKAPSLSFSIKAKDSVAPKDYPEKQSEPVAPADDGFDSIPF